MHCFADSGLVPQYHCVPSSQLTGFTDTCFFTHTAYQLVDVLLYTLLCLQGRQTETCISALARLMVLHINVRTHSVNNQCYIRFSS